jgi:hypothetical protein
MKFLVTLVLDAASRHKKTCILVARLGKAKAREQCHGCSTSIQEGKVKALCCVVEGCVKINNKNFGKTKEEIRSNREEHQKYYI